MPTTQGSHARSLGQGVLAILNEPLDDARTAGAFGRCLRGSQAAVAPLRGLYPQSQEVSSMTSAEIPALNTGPA